MYDTRLPACSHLGFCVYENQTKNNELRTSNPLHPCISCKAKPFLKLRTFEVGACVVGDNRLLAVGGEVGDPTGETVTLLPAGELAGLAIVGDGEELEVEGGVPSGCVPIAAIVVGLASVLLKETPTKAPVPMETNKQQRRLYTSMEVRFTNPSFALSSTPEFSTSHSSSPPLSV